MKQTLLLLGSLLLGVALTAAQPTHDVFICAVVNKNYVIGSTIVTTNGVFRLTEAGEWAHVSFNDTTIVSIDWDPRDPNVFYLASLNGCWRTRDGGQTWRITTGWDITEPREVVVDPNAPDHVYLALPDGVAVSRDRGDTWRRREQGLPERGKYAQTIKVDRTSAGRVLVGCETGIYLTTNGADSWSRVLPTETTVTDLQQSPHAPRHWLAVTQSKGAWHSTDGGATWSALGAVPSEHALYNVAFDATNDQRFVIGSWAHGVLTSEDGGKTWQKRNEGLPESPRVWRVGVHPDTGGLYASVVAEALYVSDDFGRSWEKAGLESSQIHAFVFRPRDRAGSTVAARNDAAPLRR